MDFKELEQKVMSNMISPEDFYQHLFNNTLGTTRKGYPISWEQKPIRLYRARVFSNTSEMPTCVHQLSYPPATCSMGRANTAGNQVFYASSALPTTFVEMKDQIKEGSIVVVSEWRCSGKMVLQEIGLADSENQYSPHGEIMHRLFTNEGDSLYAYSSLIAKGLLGGEQIHGLLYPSVVSKNGNQNVVLKKEFVDGNLEFKNAIAYRVNEIRPDHEYVTDEIDFAVQENEALKWKGQRKKWVMRTDGERFSAIKTLGIGTCMTRKEIWSTPSDIL